MSISLDTTATGNGSANTLSWTHVVGAGSNTLLIVGISVTSQNAFGTPAASTVTYGGVSMVKAINLAKTGTPFIAEASIWFLFNPPTGSNTVLATFTGSTATYQNVGGSASYFGAQQSNTPDHTASTSGTATGAQALNITPVGGGCWAFSVIAEGGNPPTAPTAVQTQRWSTALSVTVGAGQDTNGTIAGSTNLGWTIAGVTPQWAIVAVTFAPPPLAINVPGQIQGVRIYTP